MPRIGSFDLRLDLNLDLETVPVAEKTRAIDAIALNEAAIDLFERAPRFRDLPELLTRTEIKTGSGDDTVEIRTASDGRIQVTVNGQEAWRGTAEEFKNVRIDTEGGGTEPVEQAVIDAATPLGGLGVDLHFHAEHATSYRIMRRLVGSPTWLLVVDELEADTWTGTVPSTGDHEFQVFGNNSIGEGDGSAPVTVTVS